MFVEREKKVNNNTVETLVDTKVACERSLYAVEWGQRWLSLRRVLKGRLRGQVKNADPHRCYV